MGESGSCSRPQEKAERRIEIADPVPEKGGGGVPSNQMAVLLRAAQTYLGVLDTPSTRRHSRVFYRGTRAPDRRAAPCSRAVVRGRALSARRFAE